MATLITVADETATGTTLNEFPLEFLNERVSVRELIRARIYQEVAEYNARQSEYFRGLVQPEGAERTQGGFRLRQQRKIDWEEQYKRALRGFRANGFLILVDDRQLDDLDEEIELRYDARVSFLKLVPLVGG
ncbi:MAG TPA: hypothetical protein VH482_00840 [Thermomicrobiales bacterium]